MDERSGFNLEIKACAEALQSTQKRARIALFLSLAASCIVLLMVSNLWESRQFRDTNLIKAAADTPDYLKEFSKHIADDSFYQIPVLGIQITCEDVGLLGPLALLVFSLYSLMAFRACDGQIRCAGKLTDISLINNLLENEMLPDLVNPLYRVWLFLPFIACLGVIAYAIVAHFQAPLASDPLREILSTNRGTAQALDVVGWVLTALVFWLNFQAYGALRRAKDDTNDCIKSEPVLESHKTAKLGN